MPTTTQEDAAADLKDPEEAGSTGSKHTEEEPPAADSKHKGEEPAAADSDHTGELAADGCVKVSLSLF